MIIYQEIAPLQNHLQKLRNNGKRIGFVPTMGALHEGHLSLIRESKSGDNVTVCSIFINPVQFNDKKDFDNYPVTIEDDIYHLEKEKADIIFMPSVGEMYPEGLVTPYTYNIGFLETILEGFYRPGHFQGVCRVMHRLLKIVQPHDLFMGQKDYQQCMVVKNLIESQKLSSRIHIVPTEREKNGLAMSSRNLRLTEEAKKRASAIYHSLVFIKSHWRNLSPEELKGQASDILLRAGFEKIDYVEICDANDLKPLTEMNNGKDMIALIAAFLDGIRLIDNMILS